MRQNTRRLAGIGRGWARCTADRCAISQRSGERLCELRRSLGPIARPLGEHVHDQRIEARGNAPVELPRRAGRCGVVLVHDRGRQLTGERRLAGQSLIEHTAERVDI